MGGSAPRLILRLGRMECLDRPRVNADGSLVLISVVAAAAAAALAGIDLWLLLASTKRMACARLLHGAGPPAVESINHYFLPSWCAFWSGCRG